MEENTDTHLHQKSGQENASPKKSSRTLKQTSGTGEKSSKTIVAAWRKENPNGHKSELCKLGLVSWASINRYWDSCGEGDHPYSATEKIYMWRKEHPYGTKTECIEATGLSRRSIFLLWDKLPSGEKPIKQTFVDDFSEESEKTEKLEESEKTEEPGKVSEQTREEVKEPQPKTEVPVTSEKPTKQSKKAKPKEEPKKEKEESVLVGQHGQLFFDF